METTTLLLRARDGEDLAWRELLSRYGGRLLAVIRARLGPSTRRRADTGDVLNATLLRAFERIEQFRGKEGPELLAWLSRIAENEVRDLAERHGRLKRDAGAEVTYTGRLEIAARVRSETSRLVLREEAERVLEALSSLSDEHREVILLRRLEQRSWDEISATLGRSPDACRMLLARALAELTVAVSERR